MASDNFNRADNSTGLGPDWTDQAVDSMRLLSSEVAGPPAGGGYAFYNGTDAFSSNQYSQVFVAGVGDYIGLTVRAAQVGASSFDNYLANYYHTGTELTIYRIVNGAATALSTVDYTLSSGDTLRFEVEGSTLKLKVNSSVVLTATDTNLSTGNPGLYGLFSLGNPKMDNWEGGDLVAGAVSRPLARRLFFGVGR